MKDALVFGLILFGAYVLITQSYEMGRRRGYGICVAEEDDDHPRVRPF